MLDPILRDAERTLRKSGTEADAARVLAARLRVGTLDPARVRAAARLDDPVALLAVGAQPEPPASVPPGVLPGTTLAWVVAASEALPPVERDELVVRAALAALDATWAAWAASLETTERLTRWQAAARAWLARPRPGAVDLVLKALPVIDDSAGLASDEAVRAAVRAGLRPWLLPD